ncbi:unnamed protein product [Prorocentrum cordatum]|uniref:Uncharacterized protein n=1 Tax=Prorocentrum cordatum TaxID=2364126 RepID=A0ABN9SFB6_9DINO|nr:unnamed protein product [Polarella glacialis]
MHPPCLLLLLLFFNALLLMQLAAPHLSSASSVLLLPRGAPLADLLPCGRGGPSRPGVHSALRSALSVSIWSALVLWAARAARRAPCGATALGLGDGRTRVRALFPHAARPPALTQVRAASTRRRPLRGRWGWSAAGGPDAAVIGRICAHGEAASEETKGRRECREFTCKSCPEARLRRRRPLGLRGRVEPVRGK